MIALFYRSAPVRILLWGRPCTAERRKMSPLCGNRTLDLRFPVDVRITELWEAGTILRSDRRILTHWYQGRRFSYTDYIVLVMISTGLLFR